MRKLTSKEKKSNRYCKWCKELGYKIPAIYRAYGFTDQYACYEHRDRIIEFDNNYTTMVDDMTWNR